MFDLNAGHIFVCVVEEQGFTAAETRLKMPKQTISRKINELEEHLGVRLLERSTRKLRLTSAGELFFSHAQQLVHMAIQTQEAVVQTKMEPKGSLHLATSNLFCELTLEQVVLAYAKKYPKVTIEVTLADKHPDLYQQHIDIAFVIGPLKDSSIVSKKLANTYTTCLASPLFLERFGPLQTPQDLENVPAIAYSEPIYGSSTLWHFENRQGTTPQYQDISIHPTISTPSFWMARKGAIEGIGVAKLPSSILHHEIQTQQLVPVFEDWQIRTSTLYAIFPSRKMLSLPVRTFLDMVEQAMPNMTLDTSPLLANSSSTRRIYPPKIDL